MKGWLKQSVWCALLLSVSGAAWGGKEVTRSGTAYYMFQPNFVTNLQTNDGQPAYMQIRVEVMVRDEATLKGLEHHDPYLRSELIDLFSNQERRLVSTPQGRETMRKQAQQIVLERLKKEGLEPQVKRILFTQVIVE